MGTIKIKRGDVINLPTLEAGEPAFCIDEHGLYVGNGVENIKVGSKDSVDHLLDYTRNPAFALTTGTSTAYSITVTPAPDALLSGNVIIIVPHTDCGVNPTLTINNFNPITLKHGNEFQLLAGDMKEGHVYAFRYDTVDLLLEYTNDRRLSKDFISDFTIPDIQTGDGGKILRINTTETGMYYASVESVNNYQGIEEYGDFSFDNETQIFSVSYITYWYKGVKYTSSTPITCDINTYQTLTTNTLYWLLFDNSDGILKATTSVDLNETTPLALVYWNGVNGAISIESHGYTRDISWHITTHRTVGTVYDFGLDIVKPTLLIPNVLELTYGVIFDEDIRIQLGDEITNVTSNRDWYKVSENTYTFSNHVSTTPYVSNNVLNQPHYLDIDTYSLTAVPSGEFVCTFIYGTNDITNPIYKIPTHAPTAHRTLYEAKNESPPTLKDVSPEWRLLYRFIHKGNGDFIESVDYRNYYGRPYGQVDPLAVQDLTRGFSTGCEISYQSTSEVLLYSGVVEVLGSTLKNDSDIIVNFTNHALSGVTKQPNTWYFIFVEMDPTDPTKYIPFIDIYAQLRDSQGNIISPGANISKYHNTRQARFRGSFKTDTNGDILRFIKTGNRYLYIGGYNYIIQAGGATTKTAVNCRSYVPLTSDIANVYYQLITNNRDVNLGDNIGDFFSAQAGSGFVDIPVTNDSIYYSVVSPGQVSLGIHGYIETN